jgi:hypothetical protein
MTKRKRDKKDNYPQSDTQKSKSRATRTALKTDVNSGASEESQFLLHQWQQQSIIIKMNKSINNCRSK